MQHRKLPAIPEAEEYQAAACNVVQLLQVESELIKTGRAPQGSAKNVHLVLPKLLLQLAKEQSYMEKCTSKRKLCEAKDELQLLAALLMDTQAEHKLKRSASNCEL